MPIVHFDAVGLEPLPCFVCGARDRDFPDCLHVHLEDATMRSIFLTAGARLEGYTGDPHHLRVGACNRHSYNLVRLSKLIAPNRITVEAIQLSMLPQLKLRCVKLTAAVKEFQQQLLQTYEQQYTDEIEDP